jgi:hypothetical protein
VCAIGLFAAALELHYGRRGFMPIDHSVVFDGGWRTLSGQVPFRDYTTPNSITPSLLQGLFFWVLGVSWTSYLVHAAVFNALFAVLTYVLLRLCGAGRVAATLYGGLSAVVFYPPIGTPFHDQHSFFFTLLAITLAVAARRPGTGSDSQRLMWACVPFALTAAALSKQTPALLGVPVVLALALSSRSGMRRALTWLAVGSVASIALVGAAGAVAGVEWDLVWVYMVDLPFSTGQARRTEVDSAASSVGVLSVLVVAGTVLALSLLSQRFRGEPLRPREAVVLPLGLAAALILMCVAFTRVTLNEPVEGVPLLFASIGLLQVAVAHALPDWRVARRIRLAVPVSIAIAAVALAMAWTFNSDINAERRANNIVYDPALVEPGVPDALSFMEFQVPDRYPGLHAADLRTVASFLESQPGSFVLLGDTTILNGLTGKPSVFPSLFLSEGLTIPAVGSAELPRFEERLFERLREMDVRWVVLEERTWEDVSLADLPRFQAFVDRCRGDSRQIGFFELIELAERPGCVRA